MKKNLLTSLGALLASAGLGWAQYPYPMQWGYQPAFAPQPALTYPMMQPVPVQIVPVVFQVAADAPEPVPAPAGPALPVPAAPALPAPAPTAAPAQPALTEATSSADAPGERLLRLTIGSRAWLSTGHSSYNFASNGGTFFLANGFPNPASELTWQRIQATVPELNIDAVLFDRFVGRVDMGMSGEFEQGDLRDRDFLANDRAQNFSDTEHPVHGHNMFYANADAGYRLLRLGQNGNGDPRFYFDAMAGFQYWRETYQMHDGDVLFLSPLFTALPFPPGPGISNRFAFSSARVGFRTGWESNRLSFDSRVMFVPWNHFDLEDTHFLRNLRVESKADGGFGVMADATFKYRVWRGLSLMAGYQVFYEESGEGTTQFNFAGLPPVNVHLNQGNMVRHGAVVGANWQFGAGCDNYCHKSCLAACDTSHCDPHFWASSEGLLWWFKKSPEPVPLVTANPAFVLPDLNTPGTTVALGAKDINPGVHFGGRFTGGFSSNDGQIGLEASYLFLTTRNSRQTVTNTGAPGSPVTGVPIVQTVAPPPTEQIGPFDGRFIATSAFVGAPGTYTENLASHLEGAEGNGLFNLVSDGTWRVDLLAGFRWLKLQERLDFVTQTTANFPAGNNLPAFIPFNSQDTFDAENNFYGGQVGARAVYTSGRWFGGATAKIAVGDMFEEVTVEGESQFPTRVKPPFPPTLAFPGGIFAQPTNMGEHHQNQLAYIGELNLTAGAQLGRLTRVFVGYNCLYTGQVVRPGNQLDRNVNVAQTGFFGPSQTGPFDPRFVFHTSAFWAQGVNAGLEFRF